MILLITETLVAGGAEIFVLRLTHQLNILGVNTIIFNLRRDLVNTDLVTKYKHLKIVHSSVPFDFFLVKIDRLLFKLNIDLSIRQFFLASQLKRLIKKTGAKVVHSHLFNADFFFAKINKGKLRHVITNHGDYLLFDKRKETGSGETILNFVSKSKLVLSSASSIICISQKQREYFLKNYGPQLNDKLRVIYNGYQVNDFVPSGRRQLNIDDDAMVYGMVARGIEEKGWKFALKAFCELNNPRAHLVLVGDGEYLRSLRAYFTHNSNIHWVGFSKEPLEWISIFNVGLLPSYYHAESQPNVLLECLSQGKPVICSDVGDVNLILNIGDDQKQCGFVLDVGHEAPEIDVKKLQQYMATYMDDPTLLIAHSKSAKVRFEYFTMTKCAEDYLEEYFK